MLSNKPVYSHAGALDLKSITSSEALLIEHIHTGGGIKHSTDALNLRLNSYTYIFIYIDIYNAYFQIVHCTLPISRYRFICHSPASRMRCTSAMSWTTWTKHLQRSMNHRNIIWRYEHVDMQGHAVVGDKKRKMCTSTQKCASGLQGEFSKSF